MDLAVKKVDGNMAQEGEIKITSKKLEDPLDRPLREDLKKLRVQIQDLKEELKRMKERWETTAAPIG